MNCYIYRNIDRREYLGSFDQNRMVGDEYSRDSNYGNGDVLSMLGDDPDPTVTTVRVGFGGVFGRAREESRGLTREVRLELVGFAEGLELREEKRERPGDCFRRPKTSHDLTDYIVAIV